LLKSKYLLIDNLKRFFKLNKKEVFFLLTIIILAFLTGLFCAIKTGKSFTMFNLQNFMLKNYLLNKTNFFIFLLQNYLFLILLIFLIYFLYFFKLKIYLNLLLISYLTFLLGVDVQIIISSIGLLKGLIISLVCYFPFQLCNLFLNGILILKSFNSYKKFCNIKKIYMDNKLNFFFLISLITLIVVLIEAIFLLIATKFFVFL